MPQSSPRDDFFEADTPDGTADRPHIQGHLNRGPGAACDSPDFGADAPALSRAGLNHLSHFTGSTSAVRHPPTSCRSPGAFLRETDDDPKPFTLTAGPDKISLPSGSGTQR